MPFCLESFVGWKKDVARSPDVPSLIASHCQSNVNGWKMGGEPSHVWWQHPAGRFQSVSNGFRQIWITQLRSIDGFAHIMWLKNLRHLLWMMAVLLAQYIGRPYWRCGPNTELKSIWCKHHWLNTFRFL